MKSRDTENGPKRHLWHLCSPGPCTQRLPQLSLVSQKQGSATLLVLTFPQLQHICLCACILMGLDYAASFTYLLFLQDSRFYYSSSKKAAAERVKEQQCKLQGNAEELRSPAVARISKLAYHSILMSLVFLQIALILDI